MTEAPAETTSQQSWKPLHRVLAIPRFRATLDQMSIRDTTVLQNKNWSVFVVVLLMRWMAAPWKVEPP